MSRRKAATTRLENGEHSIDRNTPTPRTLKGREVVVLDWSVRLHNGRLITDKRTQGRTAAEVRRRAKATAAELLASDGHRSQWKATTPIEKYLDEVSAEEIEQSGLREASLRQYRRLLRLLRKQLAGHSISSAWHYDVLVDAMYAIAAGNGAEAARQSRSVIGKYIGQPLKRHRLVSGNPLVGASLDYSRHAPQPDPARPKRGGQGLTADEQEQVVSHLLALDPAVGVPAKARGRWGYEVRVAKVRNTIDLTLFQVGTGLRISEALQITTDLFEVDDAGVMHVHVTREIAKTGIARRTPVADPRIAAHLSHRLTTVSEGDYVISAPSDPMKRWPTSGSSGAIVRVAELYKQLAEDLDIPLLEHARSHLWRTTLSSRYEEAGVPREHYSAILGHDEQTNARSYTDRTDTSALVEAYRNRHGD